MDVVSLEPAREPITRPVFVWLEIAAVIQQAVDRRRLGEVVLFDLARDEQERIDGRG